MITILSGNNHTARFEALEKQRALLADQSYDIVSFFGDEHETQDILNALTHGSLFGDRQAFVLHHCLRDEEIIRSLGVLSVPLICVEDEVSSDILKKLYQYVKESDVRIQKFPKIKGKDVEIFQITDPIYARNPKEAWLVYQSLLRRGFDIHQILGTVWWQTKLMLLVARGGGRGVHEFPLRKAQHALNKYDARAREALAQRILDMYHRGHSGEDPENLFEEFLLTLQKD